MMLIQIAGHLGADPESRFTPSGQKVTTLRVAVNIKRQNKEKTVWWRVTIWGDRFDKRLQYLKKGSAVIIWGEMSAPEIYNDKEGNPQISLDLTCEYIGFNPFGQKSENKQNESADGVNQEPDNFSGNTRNNQFSQGFQPMGNNQFQGANQFQPNKQNQQQNQPAGVMAGAKAQTQDFTDDDIPF